MSSKGVSFLKVMVPSISARLPPTRSGHMGCHSRLTPPGRCKYPVRRIVNVMYSLGCRGPKVQPPLHTLPGVDIFAADREVRLARRVDIVAADREVRHAVVYAGRPHVAGHQIAPSVVHGPLVPIRLDPDARMDVRITWRRAAAGRRPTWCRPISAADSVPANNCWQWCPSSADHATVDHFAGRRNSRRNSHRSRTQNRR